MLKSYLTSALRNILKKKTFSFINIFGLTLGIAGSLLILRYVVFELSYDRFHANYENIYRVRLDQYQNNEPIFRSSENYPGAGLALKQELPEVEAFTRLYNMGSKNNLSVTYEQAPSGPLTLKLRRFLYADSAFFHVFSYKLLKGRPERVLAEPFQAVISASYARKYFGDEDPIGKMLRMNDDDFNNELCKVTGVFEDVPENSHLKFDVLFSYETLYTRNERSRARYDQSWQRKDMYTYIQLRPGTDPEKLSARFPAIIEKYNPGLKDQNRRDELILQPLKDIHLYSDLTDEAEMNGNGGSVYFLLVIGIFILVIALVNYINLSTARSIERAREVGIRKVMGAFRQALVNQFLLESFILNFAALVLAVLLVMLTLPLLNNFLGKQLPLHIWTEGWFWLAIGSFLFLVPVLSGLYPALILSAFQPASVLKGSFSRSGKGALLRKGLVVFQFVASVLLIAGTVVVYQQMRYVNQRDLGYNMEQTIVVERSSKPQAREGYADKLEAFKTDLRAQAAVKKVTATYILPGKKLRFKVNVSKYGGGDPYQMAGAGIDYDFIEAFEMKLVAGRNFSKDFVSDKDTAVIITESASKLLGFKTPEEAIGQTLNLAEFEWAPIVVGVIGDYHHESLRYTTVPTVFHLFDYPEYFMIKANSDNYPQVIAAVEASWNKYFPGSPFEYFFLDDYFDRQYRADRQFGVLFGIFAFLAIIVACMGLFGLSAFTIAQRTKEIGIRKVLGSSIPQVALLLSKDFFVLVAVSLVIAWPLAYLVMGSWLQNFSYRTELNYLPFILSMLIVMVFAAITVGYQTVKSSLANPVNSLRSE